MGKKTQYDNYRVVLSLRPSAYPRDDPRRQKADRRAAEDLAAQAKRHVDADYISVESDAVETCEWCGATWTEGTSPHNGGCCDKDIEVMEQYEEPSDATTP